MLGIETIRPSERLDFDIDFDDWLEDGDTLISSTVTVEPAAELTTQVSNTTRIVKVWASTPVIGHTYHVTVTVVTAGGRTKVECFKLRSKGC